MLRSFSFTAIVTSIVTSVVLPTTAQAQFSTPSSFSSPASVTSVSTSGLAQPVFINPNTALPSIGTPSQLVIDPGLPGAATSIVGQPLLIVPASALSNTSFGSVVGTTQIFSVPDAPLAPVREIVPSGFTTVIVSPKGQPVPQQQVVIPSGSRPSPVSIAFTRTVLGRQLLESPGVVLFDEDLLKATCQQNWKRAIEIVDRAIAATPADQFVYRSQLQEYRQQLQSNGNRRTISSAQAARCVGG